MVHRISLADVLEAERSPHHLVASRGRERLDQRAFVQCVGGWRAAWAAQSGSEVGLHLEDSFEFACALFGAWQAGKRVWLPGDREAATVARLRQHAPIFGGDLPGAEVIAPRPEGAQPPPVRLKDSAGLVVFTSGSTGEPAAIHKEFAQLRAEVEALETAFGACLGDATVRATVSHQHIYGLLFRVLWPLSAGRPFDCERLRSVQQILALPPEAPAVLVAGPAHLRSLGTRHDTEPLPACLRAVFSSGGPLPAESAGHVARQLGHWPIEVYGSSETGGIAWRCRSEHGDAWQALPGVEWAITGERLAVRSPHLPDRHWTTTQDRVAQAGQGGFVLLGREDRIVKIGEKRVSLTSIERLLAGLAEIDAVRACVLPSPRGERVAVVAVLTRAGLQVEQALGRRAFTERLRAALAADVAPVGLPRRFRWVTALPVDALGKVTEAQLAALFGG